MPMTWNDQADAKLLIGIIKTAKPKIDYEALAVYMGSECTAYGIQHRIRKLQAKANEGTDSAEPSPAKAKKPATRKAPAKKAASKRKNGNNAETSDDIADEEDASPSKKIKKEKSSLIKKEIKEESASDVEEA